jgi:hypothetical protein
MKTVNIKKLLIGAGFATSLLLGGAAHAGVVTETFTESFNFNSYNYLEDINAAKGIGYKPDNQAKRVNGKNVYISRFDENLGTLLGVEISFETEWSLTSKTMVNDKKQKWAKANGVSKHRQTIKLLDPKKEILYNNEVQASGCKGKVSCQDTKTLSGSFNGSFALDSFALSDFIGTDMLRFRVVRNLIADLRFCGYNDRCFQKNFNNGWGGNINVAYTYSVPEPASLALLGLGLIGLGASRMKRQKV